MSDWSTGITSSRNVWMSWNTTAGIKNMAASTTESLKTAADAFIASWLKSFPNLNSHDWKLLTARKGTSSYFIRFQSNPGLAFSQIFRGDSTYKANYLITAVCNLVNHDVVVQSDVAIEASTSHDNINDYQMPVGGPLSGIIYNSINEVKAGLENDGYATYLLENSVNFNPTVPVDPVNLPRVYTSINSPSQLINAVLNKQSLNNVIAIDNTGLALGCYNPIYTLSYFVNTRSYPKYVT